MAEEASSHEKKPGVTQRLIYGTELPRTKIPEFILQVGDFNIEVWMYLQACVIVLNVPYWTGKTTHFRCLVKSLVQVTI